jgi:hypothetical protein
VLFWVASIAAREGAERILLRLSRGWLAARYLNAIDGSCPSTRLGSATGRRFRPSTDGASSLS